MEHALSGTARLKAMASDVPVQDLVVESYTYNQVTVTHTQIHTYIYIYTYTHAILLL